MRRTSIVGLLVVALAGGAAGFLLDHALTTSGRATFTPTTALPVLLVLLGAGLLALAWPIRRRRRRGGGNRVDPFRAFRVAMLARASSLLGAVVAGFAAGLGGYLLTRPIAPPVGSVTAVVATLGGAVVLVVAALIAENFCTLPKDGGPREQSGPPGALGMEDDDDEHPAAAGR